MLGKKAVQQRLCGEGRRATAAPHPQRSLTLALTPLLNYRLKVNRSILRNHMIGLRHLIETPLPGEDIITEFERDSMSVEQLLEESSHSMEG